MSRRSTRRGAAALLAGLCAVSMAVSAIAVFHRVPHHENPRHIAALAANLSDTLAPTGKVEHPGAVAAPAAAITVAGAPHLDRVVPISGPPATDPTGVPPVRGPPGAAAS